MKIWRDKNEGYTKVVSAYVMWGTLPLYWSLFSNLNAVFLLACRIISASILCIILTRNHRNEIRNLFQNRLLIRKIILAAILCGINYIACTYAYISDRIIDASLGNLILPIISILMGRVFYNEQVEILQNIAVILACSGVLVSVLAYGDIPYLSLAIAIPFSLYSILKKTIGEIEAVISITVENMVLLPLAIIAFVYYIATSNIRVEEWQIVLLILSGIVTAMPMLLFSKGVKTIPLKAVGIIQFLSPVLSTIIAFCRHETISRSRFTTFIFVFAAVIIFVVGIFEQERKESNNDI